VRRLPLLAALFLASLSVRPQFLGIGPLLPRIRADLHVSHAVAGLLSSLPVLCMGLFAPPGPLLGRALGSSRSITACLALIAAGGFARAAVPGIVPVLLMTLPIGIGMGLLGTLLPMLVKERWSDRPAFATGVYATGITVGGGLGAAIAVPVASAASSWRVSLAAMAGITVIAIVFWAWTTAGEAAYVRPSVRPPRLPVRDRTAWHLVSVFLVMTIIYYGIVTWLPNVEVDRGWSESRAGWLIATLIICHLPGGLVVSWIADRVGSRRTYLTGCGLLIVAATLGVRLVPGAAWVWAVLLGLVLGATFPLMLTLPLDVARSPGGAGAYAALMLGAGYTFAAAGPIVLGAARDATGSFSASLWIIVGTAVLWTCICAALSPARLRGRGPSGSPAGSHRESVPA
jgi:CP family cyanate transporter-like MFS transporter